MKLLRKHYKLVALATACVALGAGISAIASAGASTPSSSNAWPPSGAVARHHRFGRHLFRAVQGSVVVHTESGFVTVTFERGVVVSVSGDQLTLTERTRTAAYRTVTLTIPSNAVVRDNRAAATLGDLKPGQRVLVAQAPARTFVIARTPRQ